MGISCTSKLVRKISGFGSDRILRLQIIPAQDGDDSECCDDVKVQTFHIKSSLFAAKSPFFNKLFNNGMKESQSKDEFTLRITASEEAGFVDMLRFINDKPLNATSRAELVDVLMVADKFEVTTCIRRCIELLLKLPMTIDSALFYVELPRMVLVGEVVKPLMDQVNKCLAAHFRVFNESQQEAAMALPLSALEAVLGSDCGLRVSTEYVILQFILKWGRVHYPILEERREILTNLVARFLRFPHLTWSGLKEVVNCPDLDSERVSKLMFAAFISKEDPLPPRIYENRLIKVVQLEFARPRCIVYLSLKREDCAELFPSRLLYSQTFCLGGQFLLLSAQCTAGKSSFGLFVKVAKPSQTCTLDFEFAAMNKHSNQFGMQDKASNCLVARNGRGFPDLFRTPWNDFMSAKSEYFIDGILHLRADITLIN